MVFTQKRFTFILILMFIFLLNGIAVSAQDPIPTASQNAGNWHSVAHIDFADAPPEAGTIAIGWFALSRDGERMATISRQNNVVIWNLQGEVIDNYQIMNVDGLATSVIDASFNADASLLVSTHSSLETYYVAYRWLDAAFTEYYRFPTADVPLRIWFDQLPWLEISSADSSKPDTVAQLNPTIMDRQRVDEVLSDDEMTVIPSGPENDADSFVRIGRIAAPLAVTVTHDNLVKRWNLETGEVTATAQVDALPGMGSITFDGRYFGWRDGESQNLHLLNFDTGEDQLVAPLDGVYLPFLLLTPDASTLFSVDMGDVPTVTLWDTATGEKSDLGAYRQCNRQPDMVRISRDGSTLVIGCDTGLDVWRVNEVDK